MRRIDYFLAGLGGALMVALFYLLSPAVLQAVQYPPVMLTDNTGNYVGSVSNPIAVSGGGSSVGPTTPLQVQSLGVNTPAPATAGEEELVDSLGGNTQHMCLGTQVAGWPAIALHACPVGGTYVLTGDGASTTALNSPAQMYFRINGTAVEALTATGAQIAGSLGVGTPNPATAGDIELLDATGGNTLHMCLASAYGNGVAIGTSSCPIVSASQAAFYATAAQTSILGPTQLNLQTGSAINAITITSTAANIVGGVALQSTGGTAPTLTAGCNGAGSSVTAGSTNNRGSFVTQTAVATTCTLTFSANGVWNQIPHCQFYDANGSITPVAISSGTCTTAVCFAFFASHASMTVGYQCM